MTHTKNTSDKVKRLAHIGRLSAGIGHNIMTPLSLIMMNSDLLSMKIKDRKELIKHLNEITQQASQISRIAEIMMWKVSTEEQETPSLLQVGSLVEENIQFWMGDMFFKHKLQKNFRINSQTPPIKGIPFHFTSFVDEWISSTIERARPHGGGKLRIVVDSPEENTFFILFEDSLPPPTGTEMEVLKNGRNFPPPSQEYFPAFCRLLSHHPAEIEISAGEEENTVLRLTWNL